MKKSLFALSLWALAATAQSTVLVNNGEVTNGFGLSVMPAANGNFGYSSTSTFALAEDFLVGVDAPWTVESLDFFGYQTDASVFSFTSVTWSLVLGDVDTGGLVASGTTAVTNGGLMGYRVSDANQGSLRRAIYRIQADIPDVALAAGSYWLRWQLSGDSQFSGPFVPPTSDGQLGNAMQSNAGAPFAALADSDSGDSVNLPFLVYGQTTVVPEPSTYALLMLGLGGVLAASRRRKG
jgi:PEP-CTERM motif